MAQPRSPKKLDSEGLWAYALKLLGGRAMSAGEVRQRLARRAENAMDIDSTMGKLREYGYLNDTRFAENYATWRRDNQGLGRLRVIRDLRQRRVAPAVASTAVEQVFRETDETEQIQAYLDRKFRNVNLAESLKDPKKLQAAYRRLRYAGFASAASIRVLKQYAAQAEELEDPADTEE